MGTAEKDKIVSTNIKYRGYMKFADFYKFCFEWLTEETGLSDLQEKKYTEKVKGDTKEMDIEWEGSRKLTDYFKMEIKVVFEVRMLKKVEIQKGDKKINTEEGEVKVKVTGTLIRDYQGKFDQSGFLKFLRAIYEKWVIPSRVDQFEDKVAGDCIEFLDQAKAYLDLEGRK